MLNALLLMTSVTASVPSAPACPEHTFADSYRCEQHLDGHLAEIVEAAWQEAQDQKEQPKTREQQARENDLKGDRELGKKASLEVEKEYKLSEKKELAEKIQRIGTQLSAIANVTPVEVTWGDKRLAPFEYEFKLIEGSDINAFCLPGGYVYVFEGLLEFVESDDELAGVLAHEIAHASLRHLAELRREAKNFDLATIPAIIGAILTGNPGLAADLGSLSQLLGLAKQSGWSVKAEEAADYAGFQYIQKTQYNAVGMLTLIERLGRKQRYMDGMLGIFQTHPVSKERAQSLLDHLQKAEIPIRRSLVSKSYRVELKTGDAGVEAWFGDRKIYTFGGEDALVRAERAANRLNEFYDKVPELFDLRAQENAIVGSRRVLFTVEQEDAQAMNTSVEKLHQQTLQAIKSSLYQLAYRIWDRR